MHQDPFLSIVIPVFNEARRIEPLLQTISAYVKKYTFEWEILIVDDGSTDTTVSVIRRLLNTLVPGMYRIEQLEHNQGKGGALRAGMLAARGRFILFLDADGSTAISELDNFIPVLCDDYDIFIAVRTKKHAAPFKRRFFGYGYIFLANFLLGMRTSDFTCGFKCYSMQAAHTVFSRQRLNNWSFDAEDLFIAKKSGLRIREIPVYWKHVGESKVKVFKNVIICGIDLLRIRIYSLFGHYR
jgi:dolichyl-phosphate beta-glucosyltransferase